MSGEIDINMLLHDVIRKFQRTGCGMGPCTGAELADYGEAYEKVRAFVEDLRAENEQFTSEILRLDTRIQQLEQANAELRRTIEALEAAMNPQDVQEAKAALSKGEAPTVDQP